MERLGCHSFPGSLNSTMVRLKPQYYPMRYADFGKKSQFHYGSIKTENNFEYKNIVEIGLNSTMVRLKRHRYYIHK